MPLFEDQKQMLFIHHFPTHTMIWTLTESKNDSDYEQSMIDADMAFRDLEGVVWFADARIWFVANYVIDAIVQSTTYYNSTIIELQ